MTSQDPTLAELGWRPIFSEQLTDEETARAWPVRVMAVHRGKIAVAGSGPDRLVRPSLPDGDSEENQPTVGDWLLIDRETGQLSRILRRANLFKRRAPGHRRGLQLIAANLDTLFIVAACNQEFNLARIERYLVLAREAGVEAVIVLTKADLTETPEVFAQAARTLHPDLPVEVVNARDPTSVARLASWCGKGATVALLGSSGVGKSTLVNTLTGSQEIATQAVREADGQGRHTTTVRQMHRLQEGGWLVDTPGMRELQLSDAASGLAAVFDDIIELARDCRFSDCAHLNEPGCAVLTAMAAGTLDPVRFERWRKLLAEDALNTVSLAERKGRSASFRPAARNRSSDRTERD